MELRAATGDVEFAHLASLDHLEFSVKVVRHRIGISLCGGLWKRGGAYLAVENVVSVFMFSQAWNPTLQITKGGLPAAEAV